MDENIYFGAGETISFVGKIAVHPLNWDPVGMCLIILTSATPFLKTFLTTTPKPSSHISDFRNLPRSDSRADKPDIFPGFDFIDEPTTMRIKTPLDFYTKFIGRIVSQGRRRYEGIVNNLQHYQVGRRGNLNSSQRLVYIPTEQNAKIIENVPNATVFDELTLDGSSGSEMLKPPKEQNWTKKYFSSILTAVGFDKLRSTSDPDYNSKMLATSATYINPLVNIWKTASEKFHFERDATVQQNQGKKSTDNEINMNISSPLLPRSASSPLPFRNAFSKYSNLMSKGYRNDDENKTMSMYSELSGVPLGDVNLNNNNTMGVDVDFPIEKIDEQNDGTENDDDEPNENGNFDAGNVGIFILEIFGTVAGLTWGAFSQIQNLFTQNGK